MNTPETSVIIRTYNEERHLPGLLNSLSEQSYRDFEIVVVDSGSLDHTREIAARSADKLLRIDSHDFTFGYSLNVGIQNASGKYAVNVSAHTVPTNNQWLGSLIDSLAGEKTAMSYGRQLGWSTSKFSEMQDLGRAFGRRRRVLKPPNFFGHNANSAIRRDLWEQHPFDETLPGLEDIEWVKYWMERGYSVVYDPDAAVHHIHEENWRQIRRRYYREGVAARRIGIKGRRHTLTEVGREAGYTLLDFGRAVWESVTRSDRSQPLLQRGRDIILYRSNKLIGSGQGLWDGIGLQDPMSRETLFFDRSCRAVVVHGPGRSSLEEVSIPEVKPGDVLIRIAYNGICGTDLDIFDGSMGYYKQGVAKYPIVPGHEFSGRVVATGPNVGHLKEGDRVVAENVQSCGNCPSCLRFNSTGCSNRTELGVLGRDGGYAEYVVVPGRFVHVLPSDVDLRKAALCQPLAMILKGLNRLSRCWPDEPAVKACAVVGGGSLGHMAARVLALRKHSVTVFDRDPVRRGYFQGTNIAVSDDLSLLTNYEALVEVTGDPESLDIMLHQSAPGATILLLGMPYVRQQVAFEDIAAYDKTVVGSVGCGTREFDEALMLLPHLDLDAHLQCVMPLARYREGWDNFRERKQLKVLLSVDPEL